MDIKADRIDMLYMLCVIFSINNKIFETFLHKHSSFSRADFSNTLTWVLVLALPLRKNTKSLIRLNIDTTINSKQCKIFLILTEYNRVEYFNIL